MPLARATAHLRMADFDEALVKVDRAVQLDEQLFVTYRLRGQVHLAQFELEAAIEDFTTALDLAPDDVDSLARRSIAASGSDQLARARDDADRPIELAPDSAWVHEAQARLALRIGDLDGALMSSNRAVSLSADDLTRAEVLLTRAAIHMWMQSCDEFEADLLDYVASSRETLRGTALILTLEERAAMIQLAAAEGFCLSRSRTREPRSPGLARPLGHEA